MNTNYPNHGLLTRLYLDINEASNNFCWIQFLLRVILYVKMFEIISNFDKNYARENQKTKENLASLIPLNPFGGIFIKLWKNFQSLIKFPHETVCRVELQLQLFFGLVYIQEFFP